MFEKVMIFAGGLLVGAGIGLSIGKCYFEKKANERADQEIEEYKRENGYYRDYGRDNSKDEENPREDRGHLRETVGRRTDDGEVNYRRYYENSEESKEGMTAEELKDETIMKEFEDNKSKPPFIIDIEEIGDMPPGTDDKILYYYSLDSVWADEDHEQLSQIEVDLLLGDAIPEDHPFWEYNDEDHTSLFVMNYGVNTCYEVIKIHGSYDSIYEN